MNIFTRFLSMAVAVLAFVAITMEAHAQFPQCNGNQLTITNASGFDVVVCIKFLGCFSVKAGADSVITVLPGTQIPGVAGVANITYQWRSNFPPPPAFWIPSLAMNPSGLCFNVFYDGNCHITVQQSTGFPPCLNP